MADARTWQTLHTGEAPDLVLAADFPMTGRSESGFPDLAARLGLDGTLWQTVPPVVAPESAPPTADYIRAWVDTVRAEGRPVRAVLGYCAGAVLAAALCTEISGWQERPRLVLFDPEVVTVPVAHIQFGRVIANMTALLTEEEVERLRTAAETLAGRDGIGVGDFTAELFAVFRPVGMAAFARGGMEEEFAAELVGLIGSFMAYLGAASRFDPRSAWRHATVISSGDAGSGLSMLRAGDPDGFPVAAEREFTVAHHDLLRDDEVAKVVAELLEAS